MSRTVKRSGRFKKDFKRLCHDAVVVREFTHVLSLLVDDLELPEKYCDHPLHNDWEGARDCHIRPDVVLIYRKIDDVLSVLNLERIGSHSELF